MIEISVLVVNEYNNDVADSISETNQHQKRQLAYGNQEIVAIKKMKLSLSRLRSQYLELNIDSLRSHKNVSFYIEKNCRAAINYLSMYRKVPRPHTPIKI